MSDEFGPWVQHDGTGCLLPAGTIIACVWLMGAKIGGQEEEEYPVVVGENDGGSWLWSITGSGIVYCPDDLRLAPIIRYRVKKPKGLTILENLIAEIPEEVAG